MPHFSQPPLHVEIVTTSQQASFPPRQSSERVELDSDGSDVLRGLPQDGPGRHVVRGRDEGHLVTVVDHLGVLVAVEHHAEDEFAVALELSGK